MILYYLTSLLILSVVIFNHGWFDKGINIIRTRLNLINCCKGSWCRRRCVFFY